MYKKNLPPDHIAKIEKHGIEETMYFIDLPETWDKYKIYWYVRTIDEFGAYTDTELLSFNTNNTGAYDCFDCFIKGYVYSALTKNRIKSASVMLGDNDYLDMDNWLYWGNILKERFRWEHLMVVI